MAVPPLHHCIDSAGINGVGFHKTGWDTDIINDMQQGYSQDETAVKPVCYINMLYFAFGNGTEENYGVSNPNQCD